MQVKRIGKFKSAGDQLLRKDMSEPQREQLSALLDGLYDYFLSHIAKAWPCECRSCAFTDGTCIREQPAAQHRTA